MINGISYIHKGQAGEAVSDESILVTIEGGSFDDLIQALRENGADVERGVIFESGERLVRAND